MKEICLEDLSCPVRVAKIFSISIRIFRSSIFGYLLLSLMVYLPLLLMKQLGRPEFASLIELIHGSFLDMLVFLTLPTLIIYKKVYPIGTIRIFLQRFFASAVILALLQLSLNYIGGLGFLFSIFILFSGCFLVIENSPKIVNIKSCLMQSFTIVRKYFFQVIWNFLAITIIITVPASLFALWYFYGHREFWETIHALDSVQEHNTVTVRQLLETSLELAQEPKFLLGRVVLHIVFRPLKSIFMAVLFISIMQLVDPTRIGNFLSIRSRNASTASPTEGS